MSASAAEAVPDDARTVLVESRHTLIDVLGLNPRDTLLVIGAPAASAVSRFSLPPTQGRP